MSITYSSLGACTLIFITIMWQGLHSISQQQKVERVQLPKECSSLCCRQRFVSVLPSATSSLEDMRTRPCRKSWGFVNGAVQARFPAEHRKTCEEIITSGADSSACHELPLALSERVIRCRSYGVWLCSVCCVHIYFINLSQTSMRVLHKQRSRLRSKLIQKLDEDIRSRVKQNNRSA